MAKVGIDQNTKQNGILFHNSQELLGATCKMVHLWEWLGVVRYGGVFWRWYGYFLYLCESNGTFSPTTTIP
ncbi:MAG: hypothetical protein ACOVSW_23870 [Candidatus Kapaibacteriota bacterium]